MLGLCTDFDPSSRGKQIPLYSLQDDVIAQSCGSERLSLSLSLCPCSPAVNKICHVALHSALFYPHGRFYMNRRRSFRCVVSTGWSCRFINSLCVVLKCPPRWVRWRRRSSRPCDRRVPGQWWPHLQQQSRTSPWRRRTPVKTNHRFSGSFGCRRRVNAAVRKPRAALVLAAAAGQTGDGRRPYSL